MPYHPTPLHAIAATVVMTTGQRDILHAAGNELAALRAERDELRAVMECIAGAALKAAYGSPSSWGDNPPTRFEFGKDTGEPLTPAEASQHDNGVIDAYREVLAVSRAALGEGEG